MATGEKASQACALGCAIVIAAAFFCVHHFMPILHSDTLVPALQSPWFKPHIIAYMLAYTLMASAAVIALYLIVRGAVKAMVKSIQQSQSHILRRHIVDYHRHALRCPVGKGGMGTLLVVGPQGDVGCHHLVCLSGVCALQANTHSQAKTRFVDIAHLLRTLTDVLVGHQLPAFSKRLQRSCL